MSIPVYQVQSPLSQVTQAQSRAFLDEVQQALGEALENVSMSDFRDCPFGLIYVASGGSEGIFLSQYRHIAQRPCYILTSGQSNSLAASMEILSYLRQHGKKGEILHGGARAVALRIRALRGATAAIARMRGAAVGLVGDKSDWLIASGDDDAAYRAKLGVTLRRIPMEELLGEIARGGYTPNAWTERLLSLGYDRREMDKALAVYGALERVVASHNLSGVSVRCFDLLDAVHTTGCLALALLNARGVYGGCEGDVPALMSMYILGEVSGQPVFLCNPSRIDTEKGEMVLAHCTLPVNMPSRMALTTHYESGIGVAIRGHIPQEDCTLFKTSAGLERYFARAGRIVENLNEAALCRTQIRVQVGDPSYFLTNPINNHHLVCLGDHTAALAEFFAQIAG